MAVEKDAWSRRAKDRNQQSIEDSAAQSFRLLPSTYAGKVAAFLGCTERSGKGENPRNRVNLRTREVLS